MESYFHETQTKKPYSFIKSVMIILKKVIPFLDTTFFKTINTEKKRKHLIKNGGNCGESL